MKNSWVFNRKPNEAGFCIIDNLTDRLIGAVYLVNDAPENLSIQLEPPIVKPTAEASLQEIEACFLLMDRLFALGYRRIQMAIDSQDSRRKKIPARLAFTQEGMILKHMIVKEANRDSNIYGVLNSDWEKGARDFMFKKIHGEKMQTLDNRNKPKD